MFLLNKQINVGGVIGRGVEWRWGQSRRRPKIDDAAVASLSAAPHPLPWLALRTFCPLIKRQMDGRRSYSTKPSLCWRGRERVRVKERAGGGGGGSTGEEGKGALAHHQQFPFTNSPSASSIHHQWPCSPEATSVFLVRGTPVWCGCAGSRLLRSQHRHQRYHSGPLGKKSARVSVLLIWYLVPGRLLAASLPADAIDSDQRLSFGAAITTLVLSPVHPCSQVPLLALNTRPVWPGKRRGQRRAKRSLQWIQPG